MHFIYFCNFWKISSHNCQNWTLTFFRLDSPLVNKRNEDESCKEFELYYEGNAKLSQASRLGHYKKEPRLVNNKVSYFNEEKQQYLYWVNKPGTAGYWMVWNLNFVNYTFYYQFCTAIWNAKFIVVSLGQSQESMREE